MMNQFVIKFLLLLQISHPTGRGDIASNISSDVDPGFDLLFTSNLTELSDVPLNFMKPLPIWIKGKLIRNGLGRFEVGQRRFIHAFDAYGKLSSVTFTGNGRASYTTKYIRSSCYDDSVSKGDIAPYLMFESVTPAFNFWQRTIALIRGLDNMNVNVVALNNPVTNTADYVAVNDFWKMYMFNASDLSTLGPVTPRSPLGNVNGITSFLSFLSSAHPLPEQGTKNHITFLSTVSVIPGVPNRMTLIRILSVYEREAIASWTVKKVPYIHSFSVTQNYAILMASPFFVNVLKMLKTAEPFNSLDWHDDEPTTVYVIHLRSGNVTTMLTKNSFIMHHVNAYEDKGGRIIKLDASAYPNPEFIKSLQVKTLFDRQKRNAIDTTVQLYRYTINLETKVIKAHRIKPTCIKYDENIKYHKQTDITSNDIINIIEVPYKDIDPLNITPYVSTCAPDFTPKIDMPTINEYHRSKKYCYLYGVAMKCDGINFSNIALVKKDLCQKTGDKIWMKRDHYPSEAWFVPKPNATKEDEGLLLSVILDGKRRTSYLAIIDAKTMEIINSADLPTVAPFSLHGRFFSDLH